MADRWPGSKALAPKRSRSVTPTSPVARDPSGSPPFTISRSAVTVISTGCSITRVRTRVASLVLQHLDRAARAP